MECERCLRKCRKCGQAISRDEIDDRIVQIIPAQGWVATWEISPGGVGIEKPLVAWGLCPDGAVVPLAHIDEGIVGNANLREEKYVGAEYHPLQTNNRTKEGR